MLFADTALVVGNVSTKQSSMAHCTIQRHTGDRWDCAYTPTVEQIVLSFTSKLCYNGVARRRGLEFESSVAARSDYLNTEDTCG